MGRSRGAPRRGEPRLYRDVGWRAHYYWLTLCAMTTHPAFCCCHTVIMCCGVEGSACEPTVPCNVMLYVTTIVVPFNSLFRSPNVKSFNCQLRYWSSVAER